VDCIGQASIKEEWEDAGCGFVEVAERSVADPVRPHRGTILQLGDSQGYFADGNSSGLLVHVDFRCEKVRREVLAGEIIDSREKGVP
jgi:hypothetical protein